MGDMMDPAMAIDMIDEILEEIEDDAKKERTAEFLESLKGTLEDWEGESITDRQQDAIEKIYEETFGRSKKTERVVPGKAEVQARAQMIDAFTKAMLRVLGDHADDLERHVAADRLMAAELQKMGYGEGVKVYRDLYSLENMGD